MAARAPRSKLRVPAVVGISVDRGGLSIENGSGRPRMIFVTPSHQYPTGRLMSINRRRELLALASRVGARG